MFTQIIKIQISLVEHDIHRVDKALKEFSNAPPLLKLLAFPQLMKLRKIRSRMAANLCQLKDSLAQVSEFDL